MAQQKKGKKETAKKSEEDSKTAVENNKGSTEVVEKGKKIKGDLDELLDGIDDLLEENAEEFVRSYVQKGGE